MKNLTKILWGVALIIAGVLFALNAFDVIAVKIFFDGWWTLFIIIPCFVGICTDKEKTGNIIGFIIGVLLLLCCQDVFGFDIFWKLVVPVIVVTIGLKLILSAVWRNQGSNVLKISRKNGEDIKVSCAVFSGREVHSNGEVFNGAELTAVFGSVGCDLRKAVIEKDCAISATAVFGGIEILLPDTVNVKVNSNSVFGGVEEKNCRPIIPGAVTVYVNATCVFGGVEVK